MKTFNCANCKVKVDDVDHAWEDIHVLCNRCDYAYVLWRDRGRGIYIDQFLTSYAARKCKSSA